MKVAGLPALTNGWPTPVVSTPVIVRSTAVPSLTANVSKPPAGLACSGASVSMVVFVLPAKYEFRPLSMAMPVPALTAVLLEVTVPP